ncbi:MAG: acetoacetate--CoA ligase [Pseudomonadales bacterium]|nr:acetoacetate--CoA ligase [Pseudomonadales bacterium]
MKNPLWSPAPQRIAESNMQAFQAFCDVTGGYEQLHQFSVTEKAAFWSAVWDYCGVIGDKGETVLRHPERMPGAEWFPEAKLNFAENLLRYRDDKIALIAYLETGQRRTLSYAELYQQVASTAAWLAQKGVQPGDRVAALLPNIPEAMVVMLAATSLGAIFSSCSPDFGVSGILDRFGQIGPKVLVTCDGYFYNGKPVAITQRVERILEAVDSIEQVLMVKLLNSEADNAASAENVRNTTLLLEVLETPAADIKFHRTDFNHPLYIMYSSGTTGAPKCIVHGVGGTLLQHLKEHQLHTNLQRQDKLFFFTTCGWMMWNWLASGLATGATMILYDGSPFHPAPNAMINLAEQEQVSIFGTSAKYLASLQKAEIKPAESHNLAKLHTVLSTGSPLSHESYNYVYTDFKQDICLASISGGTDIISCFVLGNPNLPVFEGELQCAGLGMDVKIYDDQGKAIIQQKGEMVCQSTFPSMPIGFWNDASGEKYHAAYFAKFDNIWAHGDYGEQTANDGYVIYGRSDAVLNPGGVRIGTAEIYRQVEKIDAVLESVCIGQDWQGDVRVILFVVLRPGIELGAELVAEIKSTIRQHTSPRHVPALVIAVADIPRTISGKIVELAVRNVVHGRPVTNTDALANPESLAGFKGLV